MQFIGKLKQLDKYPNSTYLGEVIHNIRLIKNAQYDDEGYLSETMEVVLYNTDGIILTTLSTYNDFEESHTADYILCDIQYIKDINVSK